MTVCPQPVAMSLAARLKAGVLAWLSGRPRGRWATAKGRWVRTIVTAGLLVAGLSAWALALVQPWTGRSGEYGIMETPGGLDTIKVRALSAEIERLRDSQADAAVPPLRRNPFATAAEAVPAAAPSQPKEVLIAADGINPAAPIVVGGIKPAASAPAMLEAVKALRLEVILTTPEGKRWAVINGQNVQEGEVIAGLEVIEIQEGKVKLQQNGFTCLLRLD